MCTGITDVHTYARVHKFWSSKGPATMQKLHARMNYNYVQGKIYMIFQPYVFARMFFVSIGSCVHGRAPEMHTRSGGGSCVWGVAEQPQSFICDRRHSRACMHVRVRLYTFVPTCTRLSTCPHSHGIHAYRHTCLHKVHTHAGHMHILYTCSCMRTQNAHTCRCGLRSSPTMSYLSQTQRTKGTRCVLRCTDCEHWCAHAKYLDRWTLMYQIIDYKNTVFVYMCVYVHQSVYTHAMYLHAYTQLSFFATFSTRQLRSCMCTTLPCPCMHLWVSELITSAWCHTNHTAFMSVQRHLTKAQVCPNSRVKLQIYVVSIKIRAESCWQTMRAVH
jgi:hypothetical protein